MEKRSKIEFFAPYNDGNSRFDYTSGLRTFQLASVISRKVYSLEKGG